MAAQEQPPGSATIGADANAETKNNAPGSVTSADKNSDTELIPGSDGESGGTKELEHRQRLQAGMSCCLAAVVVSSVLLAGCGRDDTTSDSAGVTPSDPLPTAMTLGKQTVRSNQEYLASPEFSGTDSAWGERLSMQCRACHGLDSGSGSMLGPSLYGMFGRKAGSSAGFDYSAAFREVNFIWTPRAMDAWLAQPAAFLPGNRMAFAGISKADDRRAIVAYLLATTDEVAEE